MVHLRQTNTKRNPLMCLSLVLLVLVAISVHAFPSEICTTDSECEEGFCCRLSMSRYSTPTCEPMRAEGDLCRKASEKTTNHTLSYPNGDKLELKRVHLVMCPCGEGLFCGDTVCERR